MGQFQFAPDAGKGSNMWSALFQGLSGIPGAMVKGPFVQQEYDREQAAIQAALDQNKRLNELTYLSNMAGFVGNEDARFDQAAVDQAPDYMRGNMFEPTGSGQYKLQGDFTNTPDAALARALQQANINRTQWSNVREYAMFPAERQYFLSGRGGSGGYTPEDMLKFMFETMGRATMQSPGATSGSATMRNLSQEEFWRLYQQFGGGAIPPGGMAQPRKPFDQFR